jgi:hypothetical protein
MVTLDLTLFRFPFQVEKPALRGIPKKDIGDKDGIFGNPFRPISVPEHAVLLSSLVPYSS